MRIRLTVSAIVMGVFLLMAPAHAATVVASPECQTTATTCTTTFWVNGNLSRIDVQADYLNFAAVGEVVIEWHDAFGRLVQQYYCDTANVLSTGTGSRGLTCLLIFSEGFYYGGTQTLTVSAGAYVGSCPSSCTVHGKLILYS